MAQQCHTEGSRNRPARVLQPPAQQLLQVGHHRLQPHAIHTRQQQDELLAAIAEQLV